MRPPPQRLRSSCISAINLMSSATTGVPGVGSENGLQSTLGGMLVLKTNGLARLHNGDKPALSLGFKLLILFARNFLSVLYCPFPEETPTWTRC
jgi:hypothetical protein